ncbi:unnamed protein product [Psylliodes chrysocephalus]|uniref:C2H2-type domain-containing protein n=1 Tax=Psylliodes chrysocephalus TaxID=3402493 RepID=A0A9P0CWA0_9CUCU|nr:unnamed protein product [Psylliodes chrysocephala]
MANEQGHAQIELSFPFEDRACLLCLQAGRNIFLLSFTEEKKHYSSLHKNSLITYKCNSCRKIYQKIHAAVTHTPKYPGPTQPEDPVGAVICQYCNRSFMNRRAYTAHERQAHPVARNEARTAGADIEAVTPRPAVRRRGGLFSDEEITRMIDTECLHWGDPYMAVRLKALACPAKTLKQIREKGGVTCTNNASSMQRETQES